VQDSCCEYHNGSSKPGPARTFEFQGEVLAANGTSTCGTPGRTRGYSCEATVYCVSPAAAWRGETATFHEVYRVMDNPDRDAKVARVNMGSLAIRGKHRGKDVVFHSPRRFVCECPRAYRACVICPGQLTEKWQREILNTIPGAIVYKLESYAQVLYLARQWAKGRDSGKKMHPMGPEFYIIGRDSLKLSCGWKPVYLTKPKRPGCYCPKCGYRIHKTVAGEAVPVGEDHFFNKRGKPSVRRKCETVLYHPDGTAKGVCGERLWQEIDRPRKYSPARIIQKKMKGFFDVGVIDEAHEYKSGDSLQADAVGAVAGSCKKIAALTGTLVGGYAWHVRTLLFRIGGARTMIEEGLGWTDEMEFSRRFGRIETKIVSRDEGETAQGHALGRGGKKGDKKTTYVRPGIMPTLFRHLIGTSVFLGLGEVAENLPPYSEEPLPVEMDPELAASYQKVDRALTDAIKDMVRTGNKKMLGTMLNCLLCYPDYPFDWGEIGYYKSDEDSLSGDGKVWVSVVTPDSVNPAPIRPKEQAALDYCRAQKRLGRQTWVYVCYTDKRDCIKRLEGFLKADGFRVGVMRSSVAPAEREEWINKHGRNCDVILSHPQLVQTGLDFFSPATGHNFCSILFYQTGYNLFTLMQASRRAWRIGQKAPCEVAFLYYENTMQARAMALMGKKMLAARNLNGQFSAEGLAAMAGEEAGAEMELAKSLSEKVADSTAVRSWVKVSVNGGRPLAKLTAAVVEKAQEEEVPDDWEPEQLDLFGDFDADADANFEWTEEGQAIT
jgi:hypothetical protein